MGRRVCGRERALVWQDSSIPEFLEHLHLIRSQANNGIFLFFSSGILIKKRILQIILKYIPFINVK